MKLKKRLIEGGILAAIFISAVILFEVLTNQGNENMTADMSSATLPQVSFSYNGYNLNVLPGYVDEMTLTSMRDTITPVTKQQLTVNITAYNNVIQSVDYQVYTLDGKTQLAEGVVDDPGENLVLDFSKEQEDILDEERVLKLTLMRDDDSLVYYYTRIVDAEGTSVLNCLDYMNDFHENAINKEDNEGIGASLEPNEKTDNSTFQHVDIHSSYSQVTWGDLEPVIENGMRWNVKEITSNYTSVQLQYQVRCKGEENETDLYNVKEFFRVRHTTDGNTTYLLDYEREMEQLFDPTKQILSENGILLGIAPSDVQYMVNKDGSIVSFVSAGELWNYNKNEDEVSLVFSFADAENVDVRNLNPSHEVKILDVDKSGNTTFAVYGYMNRGEHEGQVGVCIYYFDIEKNSVDERVFISSNQSYEKVDKELESLVYYNVEENTLYAIAGGTLYDYNVVFDDKTALVEGLSEGQYTVSDDSSIVAYQSNGDLNTATQVTVLDLNTGAEQNVTCEQDECIRPLGFVKSDFVYGVAKTADVGKTVSGETTAAMYKVEIIDSDGEVVKTYQNENIYVLGASFDGNMITLKRATKNGDTYTSTSPDYITNNDEKRESNIYLESYITDLKETQMRLTYSDGISDKNPKILNPKQVLFENPRTVSFDTEISGNKYYVYAQGELKGIYDTAGAAIEVADQYSGVVVAADQNYVWERGNRDLAYSIEEGDSLLQSVCDRLNQGEAAVDAVSALNDGKVLDLSGCSIEELLYIINQGKPVIAVLNSQSSIPLVGYTDETVEYMDVKTGNRGDLTYEELEQKTQGSGHTFIGFQK